MITRYELNLSPSKLIGKLKTTVGALPTFQASANWPDEIEVSPLAKAPIVTLGHGRAKVEVVRWGLQRQDRAWPDTEQAGESDDGRRRSFSSRCLVPVSSLWITEVSEAADSEYEITADDTLWLAGVFRPSDPWTAGDFAILTCVGDCIGTPNRMPIIVTPAYHQHWLDCAKDVRWMQTAGARTTDLQIKQASGTHLAQAPHVGIARPKFESAVT